MNRRRFISATAETIVAGSLAGCAFRPGASTAGGAREARPSTSQLIWQRDEVALFLHFGMNTFTDREWGDGRESPATFSPPNLDARQWARAARAAGAKAAVLTAKHHDGFCLWPTTTTLHSVAQSPWRGGSGDVVREFVDACRAEGLRTGLYLSPWDRNNPTYGDSPRYNDLYAAQLTELLTRYGPVAEVWFDGANGEGPNGKRQEYDWPRVFGLVRRLQPNAVMFSDAGPDVRWCGNERGTAGDPNWSMVDPAIVTYPGASGPGIIESLQHGHREGTVWRPAEVDVSIRPGWFHHPAEDGRVRSLDNLVELYFTSVGRNGKLLLNVPPTREGVLHATDVTRLAAWRARLSSMFERDLASGVMQPAAMELDFGRDVTIGIVRLEEDIARGQHVARYSLQGADNNGWRVLSSGTTIGSTKLDRIPATSVRRLRLTIDESVGEVGTVRMQVYGP